MENHFLLSSEKRLKHWRDFRRDIEPLSVVEKINLTTNYWSYAPIQNIAYNIDDLSSIPTIWEMVYDGSWCRNSLAFGIEGTLRLSGINNLEINFIKDEVLSKMVTIVKHDNYILNYEWGKVSVQTHPWYVLKKIKFNKDSYIEIN